MLGFCGSLLESPFVLSRLAVHRLTALGFPDAKILRLLRMYDETCLDLCEGQFIDIWMSEHDERMTVDAYFDMIGRKTAALIAGAVEAGALLATDDERIVRAVASFGGVARMTSGAHQNGTDRLAEVAAGLSCDVVVNVQGDEPLLAPEMIDEAVAPFAGDPALMMSTLRRRIDDASDIRNPNVTKVVTDRDGYALYFSRAPIPFVREGCPPAPAWRHVGLYAYRRACLLRLASLPPAALERSEALEQLRALDYGIRIKVMETAHDSIGVDTPEDLERVRGLIGTAAHT